MTKKTIFPSPLPLISRDEAIAAGQNWYFTGEACARGHVSPRLTNHGKPCYECRRENWAKNKHKYYAQTNAYKKTRDHREIILERVKQRAKQGGFEVSLSVEDITISEHCPCCSARMNPNTGLSRGEIGWDSWASPSIDRIDSAKGYVRGNVEVICWRCNRLKADGTILEFERILKYMRDRLNRGQSEIHHLKIISQGEK